MSQLLPEQMATLVGKFRSSQLITGDKNQLKYGIVDCGLIEPDHIYGCFIQEYTIEGLSYDEDKNERLQQVRGFEKYVIVVNPREGTLLLQYRKLPGLNWETVQRNVKALVNLLIARLEWGMHARRFVQGTFGTTRDEVVTQFGRSFVVSAEYEGLDANGCDQSVMANAAAANQGYQDLTGAIKSALHGLNEVTLKAKKDENLSRNFLAQLMMQFSQTPKIVYQEDGELISMETGPVDTIHAQLFAGPDDDEPNLRDVAAMAIRRFNTVLPQLHWINDSECPEAPEA